MALLAAVAYDPSTAVAKATSTLIAMTAIDTSNLRVTFTAPANGNVMVRMRCVTSYGATTNAQVLLGVLDGATVRGKAVPFSPRVTSSAVQPASGEASFIVFGLTPGNSYTWDAAYSVKFAVASSNLRYGGPNNVSSSDAWGAFIYEVWETKNLLAGLFYDPSTLVTKQTTTSQVITAFDTTNLRLTFTAPASGRVLVHHRCPLSGGTGNANIMVAVLEGSTIRGRCKPISGMNDNTPAATTFMSQDTLVPITGLTPGNSYTWDAAWGVEGGAATTSLKYGGPDDANQDSAYGGYAYEVWAA